MSETSVLTTDDAVLLAHALVARLASDSGARVLFIKGPTAVAQGVRPARPSSDVDVLVDPQSFETVCRALEGCGWELRVPDGGLEHAGDIAFDHSAHYIHRQWPTDIDVHYLFPGFLAPPEQVFDALWSRRETVTIADVGVPSPDRLGQSLVVALHALRDPEFELSRRDLEHLAGMVEELSAADPDTVPELADLARRTGSAGSAAAFLQRVGAPVAALDPQERERLVNWQVRQSGLGSSTAWLAELQRAPLRRKGHILRRALVPPPSYLLGWQADQQASRTTLAMLHLQRWVRGVRALPRAASVLARRRRAMRMARRG
jgi:hypothetical protein